MGVAERFRLCVGAEVGVDAIPGVGQHRCCRHTDRQRGADLRQRDLRLGLERHCFRHARTGTTVRVIGPGLRRIQPMCERQTGMVVGHRQRDGDLAVILFAELSAVLPGHPDRVLALLRHAGIVNHPAADRTALLNQRQHASAHRRQHGVIGPVGLGDEVVQ